MKTAKFENLNTEVQGILIDEQSHFNSQNFEVCDYNWFILFADEWGFKIDDDDIRWSGFNSQGDGASFTGILEVDEFIERYNEINPDDKIDEMIEENKGMQLDLKVCNRRYSHEKTVVVEEHHEIENKIHNLMEEKRKELSIFLYDQIEILWNEETSFENVKRNLIEDNYRYSLDGLKKFENKPITFDYSVHLNEDLIKDKNLSENAVGEIASLHMKIAFKLNTLYDNIDTLSDSKKRLIGKYIEEDEYSLQSCWKFPQDQSYHYYWKELPGCNCPRLDNEELIGTGRRIINDSCIYHGNKKHV